MNKRDKILKQIENTTEQIKKFKKRLKTSDLCEDLYDDAILKKAILLKELEECDKNPITEGLKNISDLFKKKDKKLICDYFKS